MKSIKTITLADIPPFISAVVFDFDGVFTGNKVLINEVGIESVECWRGDGIGLASLRALSIPHFILSHERNSASAYRSKKLGIKIRITVNDKNSFLERWSKENEIDADSILFLGNDVNDISAMNFVGCSVAVQDAHQDLKRHCKFETLAKGGAGAVREICDLVTAKITQGRQ
jgi:YrbI family 3-deoxy-D-manno-octulosonate 8-phosphate phosphatase